jgi:cytochrome c-type biogenesis protein CcmH/NrfG
VSCLDPRSEAVIAEAIAKLRAILTALPPDDPRTRQLAKTINTLRAAQEFDRLPMGERDH